LISRLLVLSYLACVLSGCGGGMGIHPATATANAATDDATITARVKTALLNDTQVAATKIDVATVNGVVTMSGTVKSKDDEARAIPLARQTSGVKDVKSVLQINPTPQF
jgi:hyperosmotically inducible periplasmic protein